MYSNPVAPFPYTMSPITNITPFTYRDGATYLEILTQLKNWLDETLVPEFNEKIDKVYADFQAGIANAENTIIQSKLEWQQLFDAFMANVVAEIAILNDEAIESLLSSVDTKTGVYIRLLINQLAVSRNELVVNVQDHGALTDGTDVTLFVRDAAELLKSLGGGTLYYPTGEYLQQGYVELSDNITVLGAPGSVIRKRVGSTTYCTFVALSGNRLGYDGGVKNIRITGLTFRGDLANNISIGALAAHRMKGLTVDHCEFLEASQNGHLFDLAGCSDVIIEHNKFAGIKRITGRGYVEAIQIDCSYRGGTSFPPELADNEFYDGTPTKDVTVRNNTFESITVNGINYPSQDPIGSHATVEGRPYQNINFVDNIVKGVVENDGSYPGVLHFVGAVDVTISGNKFYGQGSAIRNTAIRFFRGSNVITLANYQGGGTVSTSNPINPRGIRVKNNEFFDMSSGETDQLIWIYGASSELAEEIQVTDNTFTRCNTGSSGGYVIQVTWANSPLITGNKSYSCKRGFLYIADSINPIIDNNYGNGGAYYNLNINRSDKVEVNGNKFSGYPERVYFGACSDITIRDNSFTITTAGACVIVNNVREDGPGYMHVVGNGFHSTHPATIDNSFGSALAYANGLVANNISTGYGATTNINPTVIYANNVAV